MLIFLLVDAVCVLVFRLSQGFAIDLYMHIFNWLCFSLYLALSTCPLPIVVVR